MFRVRATQIGISELIRSNAQLRAHINRGELIKAVAEKAEELAKERAPKKTGNLILAIKAHIINQWSYELQCNVKNKKGEEYAKYVEQGTQYIMVGTPESPRQIKSGGGKIAYLPFLAWAIWYVSRDVEKLLDMLVKSVYK